MTGYHIDESGFSGAVGTNHADRLVRWHADGDIARGDHRAEALAQVADREDGRVHGAFALRRQRSRMINEPSPWGRNRMVSSSAEPSSICQSCGSTANANERNDSNASDPTNAGTTDPAPERMVIKTNSPEVVQYDMFGSTWPTASAASAP